MTRNLGGSLGIALLGTTGEANSFSTGERKALKQQRELAAIAEIEAGLPPVVHWCRDYFGDAA